MTCQELDRLLYPYLDGEFQPEERMDLETHLSGCAACQRRVETEKQMQQALRRAARHSVQGMRAPSSLRAGIQVGLKQEQRRAQYGVWLRAGAMAYILKGSESTEIARACLNASASRVKKPRSRPAFVTA